MPKQYMRNLRALGSNVVLVMVILAIVVLAAAVFILFEKVGGGQMKGISAAATALTLAGGYATLWLGRRWGFVPF